MKGIKQILTLSAAAVLVFGIAGARSQSSSGAPVQDRAGIVDADGDGICDITGRTIGSGAQAGKRKGPADGMGNRQNGPKDGTGYGAQSGKRTGPQDGSQARIGRGNGAGAGNGPTGMGNRRGGRR
ncbi:MAG: hypothetical protein JW793_16050 [Acidobacteria bacterium]|nr:hypothetical protein [Acidobacteriota bacterium]